jgi:hypothetical protein
MEVGSVIVYEIIIHTEKKENNKPLLGVISQIFIRKLKNSFYYLILPTILSSPASG